MYEFWYDYVKIKYEDKARLCYMDTDSFVVNIKTKGFYKDISQDVTRCARCAICKMSTKTLKITIQ